VILQMNQMIKVKLAKCPEFEFKSRQVNDSSQLNQRTTTWFLKEEPLVLIGGRPCGPKKRSESTLSPS
jgi:hypothetical protein